MKFSPVLLLTLVSVVVANPLGGDNSHVAKARAAADNCNGSIGNCYDNGCDGNPTTLVCLAGPYIGCPCGYNCAGAGPCSYNGCDGDYVCQAQLMRVWTVFGG
ncbi:hypothetical protein F5884DRAFT_750635 [Xylogone sp. PMI_703]|nr:hypothetical protein F5884DRAFT_750635 [Xylogone sp. PMI_703]